MELACISLVAVSFGLSVLFVYGCEKLGESS